MLKARLCLNSLKVHIRFKAIESFKKYAQPAPPLHPGSPKTPDDAPGSPTEHGRGAARSMAGVATAVRASVIRKLDKAAPRPTATNAEPVPAVRQ